jgi:hypothetical protein
MAYPSADTFSSLIDEVITSLQGFGTDNDAICTLINACSATDLVISVDDTDNISRGLIEIDEEIMYVLTADNGQAVIPPWGRGYKGTVAVNHTASSAISVAPTWPRAVVAREVNNTIRAVYPNLFAVGTYGTTASPTTWQYAIPAVIDRILAVEWRWGNTTDIDGWTPVRSWEMISSADTSDFGSGKALLIGEPLVSGARIHVTYAMAPTLLVNPSDVFTVTGLAASSRDVILYGATSRLLPWQDTARIPVESVSSDAQDTTKPVGNAIGIAKEIRNLYASRLADEVRVLADRYPTKSHKVR